jgi:hypothetical protein
MSDDEPEFNGLEDESPEDVEEREWKELEKEILDHETESPEDVEEREWKELEKEILERLDHESEIAEKEFGVGESNDFEEPSKDIDKKFESFEELSNQLADGDFSENPKEKIRLLTKIQETYLKEINKTETLSESIDISEPKQDLDSNAYNFTKTSSIISLEFAWTRINSKLNSLVEQLRDTYLPSKIEQLEEVIDDFRRTCIWEIIHSEKKNNNVDRMKFEKDTYYNVIMNTSKIYSDFLNFFLSDVEFEFHEKFWLKKERLSIKFRYYISYLRYKKQKHSGDEPHIPNYEYCDGKIGDWQSNKQKHQLYQGYWRVEEMIKQLRNYTEHAIENENKRFLKKTLKRELEDPISKNETTGNFLILVSVLFLMSYQFIETMQSWIDTDNYLKQE